jgi:HSP20 family protein
LSRNTRRKTAPEGECPQENRRTERVMLMDISDEAAYRPPSDVHETPDGVVIRMEIPGVSEAEVDVRVRGGRIVVAGEKQPDVAASDASYLCLERAFGRFHRAFDVSGSVNLSRMTAVLKGGVLVLFLPKIAERRGHERRIPIHTEESE